jgi:hypothetical protein
MHRFVWLLTTACARALYQVVCPVLLAHRPCSSLLQRSPSPPFNPLVVSQLLQLARARACPLSAD